MSALNHTARQVIKDAGLTLRFYARAQSWSDNDEGRWYGDQCGCPDDRCVDHHHDAGDDCGCLSSVLADVLEPLCRVEDRDAWSLQMCVIDAAHEGRHKSQTGHIFA